MMLSINKTVIVFFLILILMPFIGCMEEEQVSVVIKYKSTLDKELEDKQGLMAFNITIRTNDSAKTVRLWVPYPVSNLNQKIERENIR